MEIEAEPRGTLAEHARALSERRYVRPRALAAATEALLDAGPRVLLLTGRAGIGKTAALHDLARQASRRGLTVARDELTEADLVLLDDVRDVLALGPSIAALPARTRVVLAGRALRELPESLEPIAARLALAPLSPPEADALLERHDLADETARATVRAWAGGLPLALVVGARLGGAPDLEAALEREGRAELVEKLGGGSLDSLPEDLLDVLALAPSIDVDLAEELFGARAESLLERLRTHEVVERQDRRLALHPTLAHLLASELRSRRPVRAATWTLRLAAHEHRRATTGDPAALARLATLVGDPTLRTGLGAPARTGHFADRWRASDAAAVRSGLEALAPGAWPLVAPWCDERAQVVRRADGQPVALVVSLPATAVDPARLPLLSPVLRHLEASSTPLESTVLTPVQVTIADREVEEVAAIRNAAALASCGVANPSRDVANLLGEDPAEEATLRAYGYQEATALRREVEGVRVATWVADVGPAGLAGMLFSTIANEHAEHGPRPRPGDLARAMDVFSDDFALAGLPVAPPGLAVADAAEHVRAWMRSALLETFADDATLLELVLARFLTPGATHDSAMRRLYLSRATYFRRLARVRARVAAL